MIFISCLMKTLLILTWLMALQKTYSRLLSQLTVWSVLKTHILHSTSKRITSLLTKQTKQNKANKKMVFIPQLCPFIIIIMHTCLGWVILVYLFLDNRQAAQKCQWLITRYLHLNYGAKRINFKFTQNSNFTCPWNEHKRFLLTLSISHNLLF